MIGSSRYGFDIYIIISNYFNRLVLSIISFIIIILNNLLIIAILIFIKKNVLFKNSNDDDYEYDGASTTKIRHGNL